MSIFFVPLVVVAFFESNLDTRKNKFMKVWFSAAEDGEEDDPNNQDPEIHEDDPELELCKVKFADLVSTFPNTTVVCMFYTLTWRWDWASIIGRAERLALW